MQALAGPKTTVYRRGALPVAVAVRCVVRVEMQSEDGFADGGAGMPSEADADTFGPVVAAMPVSC